MPQRLSILGTGAVAKELQSLTSSFARHGAVNTVVLVSGRFDDASSHVSFNSSMFFSAGNNSSVRSTLLKFKSVVEANGCQSVIADEAKSSSVKTFGFNGHIPVRRKPDKILLGVNASSNACFAS